MQAALKGKGYNVVTAVDGEQALEKAMELLPRVMLLDVVLPKKNGFQVCRQLKTTPQTQDIKIVLVSSKTQESDRFWGMKQGADEYITKPYDAAELAASVERFL